MKRDLDPIQILSDLARIASPYGVAVTLSNAAVYLQAGVSCYTKFYRGDRSSTVEES